MPTTIKLKNSVTTTNAPSSLVQGEVAINITDKKVWVGNAATTPIQLLGAGASGTFGALTCTSLTNSGLTSGRVTYASTGGLLADSANFTFNGTTVTMANDASISGLTVGKGGGAVASNTATGVSALIANTTGSANSAFGQIALTTNTTGANNSAFGQGALAANTSGGQNAALGTDALRFNTTGSQNSAFGLQALTSNTTASDNSAFGSRALDANTTGASNTAVGTDALGANTTASNNTAVGYQALYANTTGEQSVAVGSFSLDSQTTGAYNTTVGFDSLSSLTTGQVNACFGYGAGNGITTSSGNTLIGAAAGQAITTGAKNTVLGRYNGNQGGLDIRTASNYIVLSDGDGNPRAYWRNDGVGFTTANATDGYALQIRNSTATRPYAAAFVFTAATPNNTTETFLDCEDTTNQKAKIYSNGTFGSRTSTYGGISDEKLKQDIVDASSQWNDIKAVRVRKFRFKDEPNSPLQLGVIAQEIEQTSAGLVFETPDFVRNEDGGKVETGEVTKSVKYSILYMKAIKALQEAMERIETLEAKVQQLENK